MEYTVFYPTPLSEIDRYDDNLDVCVTFADGQECTFVFATPRNLSTQMAGEGKPFLYPGAPFLIVEELTDQNIRGCLDLIAYDQTARNIYGLLEP